MPERDEILSRGRFLKLCGAGAIAFVATACGGEEDDDDEDDGEDDDEDDGGLY